MIFCVKPLLGPQLGNKNQSHILVHHRSRSQLITDTLIARNPPERAVFWCPIAIRSRSQISGFPLSDHPMRFHSDIDKNWYPWLCQSVLHQSPSTEDTLSCDQSFCDHNRNFDRALRCTKPPILLTEGS